jgi:hypothetical protein
MVERHNVIKKWETGFLDTPHCFQVQNGKYVWVLVTETQSEELVKTSAFYDGPVFTIDELLTNEKAISPDTYQMVCEFFAAIEDGCIEPYWINDSITLTICECGSESVYGPGTTHSSWCPKGKIEN